MKLVRGLHYIASQQLLAGRRPAEGCVLTVGDYDGVHLGHQEILRVVKQRAAEFNCPASVLVFEPSAKEFLDPDHAPARLTRWREKFLALAAQGVDCMVTVRFDEAIRAMSPECFVENLLVGRLGARHVVVGHDFRYGAKAQGNVQSLRDAGASKGFGVDQMHAFLVDGVRVSSTAVRERLAAADFAGAARLLGHSYRMMGRVVRGKALGRTLGYPTANLRLMRRKSPIGGILAVRVYGIGAEAVNGVASLGTRPTVNGVEPLLEVHVFDFDGDLYGRMIEVEFVAKLRDEIKFDSLDSLTAQMNADAAQAREILSKVACG